VRQAIDQVINGGLFCHRLLDEADDDHENGAAHAAAGYIADEAADIEAARLGASSRCGGPPNTPRALNT
jgi:hypothetical protein